MVVFAPGDRYGGTVDKELSGKGRKPVCFLKQVSRTAQPQVMVVRLEGSGRS